MMKFLRARTAAEELAQGHVDRPEAHQVVEEHLGEAVAPDGHAGLGRDRHDGEQAAAVGELQVERR